MTDPTRKLTEIDQQLAALINQRANLVRSLHEAGQVQEHLSDDDIRTLNKGPHSEAVLAAVFHELEMAERDLIRPVEVAYLGTEATFTHQATLKHFGHGAKTIGMTTINDVFEAVTKGRTDYGVVPVENSTEGAVRMTFDLFPDYDVSICAEVFLQIHHYMMARVDTGEITKLYSHRQVFGQCRRWLQANYPNIDCIETSSTSEAAQKAAAEKGSAALGGELGAEKYGLKVLHENIEDLSNNITRFLILSTKDVAPTGDDKTSIMVALKDRVGVLYDALLPFKTHNVNMTMIESRPSRSRNWDYVFYVDFLGHASDADCSSAVQKLNEHCAFMRILGSYPRARG